MHFCAGWEVTNILCCLHTSLTIKLNLTDQENFAFNYFHPKENSLKFINNSSKHILSSIIFNKNGQFHILFSIIFYNGYTQAQS